MSSSLLSTALPDLRDRIGCTTEQMARAIASSDVSSACVAIICGFSLDRYRAKWDLLLAFGLLILAVTTVIKPIYPDYTVVFLSYIAEGVGGILVSLASCTGVFFLWDRNSQAAVSPILSGYPIGNLLSPLFVRPFLCDDHIVVESAVNSSDVHNISDNKLSETCYSTIEIPHIFTSAIVLGVAALLVVLHLVKQPKGFKLVGPPSLSLKDTLSLSMCKPGRRSKPFAVSAMLLLAVYYFNHVARNGSIRKFLFTYAIEGDLDFSKPEAAWMDFAVKTSFFAGRLAGIPAMKYGELGTVMILANVLSALSAICLVVLGKSSKLHLTVWSCLVLGFSGSNWPAGYSWLHQTLFMGGIMMGALDVVVCCSMFLSTHLTGYFLSNDLYDGLIYVAAACSFVLFITTVLMEVLARIGRRREKAAECDDKRSKEKSGENCATLMQEYNEQSSENN